MHRDLRWQNTACSLDKRWFLLDLEMCDKEGQAPTRMWASCWDDYTLVVGKYTFASDVYLLGKMLSEHAPLVTSHDGLAFLRAITVPAKDQEHSVQWMIDHEWIGCEGEHCRAAGAQPGEIV